VLARKLAYDAAAAVYGWKGKQQSRAGIANRLILGTGFFMKQWLVGMREEAQSIVSGNIHKRLCKAIKKKG
jgi:hypothetical protein